MFIRVDLPAPFSPSSACTSPLRRSKSTESLARTPGNRLVIPRSSSTGVSSATGRFNHALPPGPPASGTERAGDRDLPPASFRTTERDEVAFGDLLDLRRRLDLAGDDLRAEHVDLLDERGRHLRVDLAEADAVVLQVEREILATLELAVLGALDREVDALIDALDRARQDV